MGAKWATISGDSLGRSFFSSSSPSPSLHNPVFATVLLFYLCVHVLFFFFPLLFFLLGFPSCPRLCVIAQRGGLAASCQGRSMQDSTGVICRQLSWPILPASAHLFFFLLLIL